MTNKLKLNSLHILKLNNQTYIPFQPHNLPNYFNNIPLNQIIKFKSYTYINLNSLKNTLKLAGFTAATILPGGFIYLLLSRIPAFMYDSTEFQDVKESPLRDAPFKSNV